LPSFQLKIDENDEERKTQYAMDYFNRNLSKQDHMCTRPESRDLEVLMDDLDKETFYIYRFKTEMCPNINIKHDYKDCLFYHNMKDYRRKPDFHRYYPDNCPNGANCPANPN
jgi:hypothetical protein